MIIRQVYNVVVKSQSLVCWRDSAVFHARVKGSYLARASWKYVSRMRSIFHDSTIGKIAVKAWVELFIKYGTDDFFLALEGKAIAGPIFGVDACSAQGEQFLYQCILLLVIHLGVGYIGECSDCTSPIDSQNEQKEASTHKQRDLSAPVWHLQHRRYPFPERP